MNYSIKFKIHEIICCFLLIIIQSGCGIYSFSGTSVPKEAKTIFVNYITNSSPLIQPNLSNNFTEMLKTKCLNETNLAWIEDNADISFYGDIKQYKIEPISIQSNETAAQNRLTISIEISYINKLDTSSNFKKVFSHYEDFNSNLNLSDIEEDLNKTIIENIIEDIFNASLVNW